MSEISVTFEEFFTLTLFFFNSWKTQGSKNLGGGLQPPILLAFYGPDFIYIWWIIDIVLCHNVALMITDSQKCKWENELKKNRKKKEEQLDISISNYENRFLNFFRIIAFTILGIFKNFVIRTEELVLCHSIKKIINFLHLWGSIYNAKLIM